MKHLSVLICLTFASCNPSPKSAPSAPVGEGKAEDTKATKELAVKNISAAEATKLVEAEAGKLVIVDVRTAEEFAGGHIPGAVNIDFNAADFEAKLAALDKTKPCLVHCQAGGRSTKSLDVFKKLKFTAVTHMDGGMNAWNEAGGPVEK